MSSSTDTADEPMPSNLTPSLSPPKKRWKKSHFDKKTKLSILNLYNQEYKDNPTLPVSEVVQKVTIKTGVCRGSVYRIIKEYNEKQEFSEPKAKQNRAKIIDVLDKFNKNAIREIVHQYFFRNELPTIDKVLNDVNEDSDLPNFKRSTFYRLLTSLHFIYEKCGRKSMLIEKDKIVIWRRKYLKKIEAYRNERRKIYYIGETWIGSLSTGLRNPSGKEKGIIFCHIGTDDGFISNGLWAFESKKTGDHHAKNKVEIKSFEKWFATILSQLDENSVIVLDNAPYCSRKVENIPTKATSKADIKQWLRSKNIHFEDDQLKVELLVVVNEHKRKYNKYVIDEMARAKNKTVLRLPPFHCELNPFELIWDDLKNIVAEHSDTCKLVDMKIIINAAINNISIEKWQKCIKDTKEKVETKMWKLDDLTEVQVEPLLNVESNTSSDENNLEEKLETEVWKLDNMDEFQVKPLIINEELLKRIKTEPELIEIEEDKLNCPFNILSNNKAADITLRTTESTSKLETFDVCLYKDIKIENEEITIKIEDENVINEEIMINDEVLKK